jgi:glycosyltransferase involved in cell wall biosynthesis
MRVLQVTGFLPPHYGGVESHVSGLSGQLSAMGVQVDVATSVGHAGNGSRTMTCPSTVSVLGNPVMRGLRRLISGGGYDLVHLHTPPQLPALQASRACMDARVPYVLTYHCDGEVPHPVLGPTVPAFMRTVGNRVLGGAERIIVTTKEYATTSPYLEGRECSVIPSGVDTSRFSDGGEGDEVRTRHGLDGRFVVGFVGRLVGHKGVETLLAAVAGLPGEDTGCLVVGDGPRMGSLKRRARALGIQGVVLTGHVPDAHLPSHYSAMDVLALPSRSREEAFGLTLLEGMASGIPLLVSRIPGPSEVAEGEFAMTFERDDVEGLGGCIARLKADAALRDRMGARARAAALDRYCWTKVAPRILELYEEVVG